MEKNYLINANVVNDTKSFYFCVTPTDGQTEIGWIEINSGDSENNEHIDLNLSYSFNKIDWVIYTKNSKITTNRPVYFRGNNNAFKKGQSGNYAYIKLSLNKLCNLSGKISSLVRWFPSSRTEIVTGLNRLFYGNTYIKSIKNLELDVVLNPNFGLYSDIGIGDGEQGTYNKMFSYCSSLLDTPIILSNLEFPDSPYVHGACMEMFSNCTSLVAIYELPAVSSEYIYRQMFSNCSSLVTIPKDLLPVTTLSKNCYQAMFEYCSSLQNLPDLPATTLATSCYAYMFRGCTSLNSLPDLPATILAPSCYFAMFSGCSSLNSMIELPATTLAKECYRGMFSNCSNLEILPQLPATILAQSCYHVMFNYCPKIKISTTQTGDYQTVYRIPITGSGIIATDSLTNMFNNTGGSFTGTPNINTTYYTSNTVK